MIQSSSIQMFSTSQSLNLAPAGSAFFWQVAARKAGRPYAHSSPSGKAWPATTGWSCQLHCGKCRRRLSIRRFAYFAAAGGDKCQCRLISNRSHTGGSRLLRQAIVMLLVG